MKISKLNKKKVLLIMAVFAIVVLTGCQKNVDGSGHTLAERIIYLTTPWKDMMEESFFTAIFVYPLSQCVNFLGGLLNSAFLGIIFTTVLFNILVLPLSIKSTVSTQKMQMLQPELARIQAKYEGKEDDNSKMQQAQEMQNLYSKNGINPLGSMLVPFLQFPILIAMYYAVQRADVVCNGSFCGVPLSTTPKAAIANISTGWPIVVIFVLMAVCQFLNTKIPTWLAERKKKSDKDYRAYKDVKSPTQGNTNIMMYSMVAMVVFIGLSWPAAMSMYWLINSVINVVKTCYIQWRYIDNA